MNSKECISEEKKVANICLSCTRTRCDAGQHAGCGFVREYGKDGTVKTLRQDVCGVEDPDQRAIREQEKYRYKHHNVRY